MFRVRRRSPWCCQRRSFVIGWRGGAGRGVVRLELKMRKWSRWFWKTQWSTIPGNTSYEKDVWLDDSATITSSNCFRRLGWILDRAVRVSHISWLTWYWHDQTILSNFDDFELLQKLQFLTWWPRCKRLFHLVEQPREPSALSDEVFNSPSSSF